MGGAAECAGCEGCQWRKLGEGENWCYMFEEAPETLPCGQHDMYEGHRVAVGRAIKRRPEILVLMLGGFRGGGAG